MIHLYLLKQLIQPVWDWWIMPQFQKNVTTCAKLGFDAQFAIFAVPLSSFCYGKVCFQRAVLFVLFSTYIWYGAQTFLRWSITCVMVKGGGGNRLAPRMISKFILFLGTFCQVYAFVCFNRFCHSSWLLLLAGKRWCVRISAHVLEYYKLCLCNSDFSRWQGNTSLQ